MFDENLYKRIAHEYLHSHDDDGGKKNIPKAGPWD
jgi:hypothetical protein